MTLPTTTPAPRVVGAGARPELRFGYGTNGFAGHRLPDALRVIADLGYAGVALTLDHPHLDPRSDTLAQEVASTAHLLSSLDLSCVVETGGRYVMDPFHKHEPTLVSPEGSEQRIAYLQTAARVTRDLGAEAMSFWSGELRPDADLGTARARLLEGIAQVLGTAAGCGVRTAMEPEPGMVVDTVAGVWDVIRDLDDPPHLGITLDIGHVVCNEDEGMAEVIARAAPRLWNVQIDDMRRGVHEHLTFGDGELDLPAALAALCDNGYGGLVSVELPRHSHAAPLVARSSLAALRAAVAG